ncbi:hypothetical protein PG999_006026 [Apiospora kogelbergensis]|uniref:Uncharacterized protein n=1 Tax=Apiospora kogelbergensis TaxID=1337665 RepID=A0AAW0QQD2_9PEZI
MAEPSSSIYSPEPPAYIPASPMIFDCEDAEPVGAQSPVYIPPNVSPSPHPGSIPPTPSSSPPPYIPQSPLPPHIQRDHRLTVPFILSHNTGREEQQRPQFYQPQPLPVALVTRKSETPLYACDIAADIPNAAELNRRMIQETLERWEASIQREEEARAQEEYERGGGDGGESCVDSWIGMCPRPLIPVRPDGYEMLPRLESAVFAQIPQYHLIPEQQQQQQQQEQPWQLPRGTNDDVAASFQPTVYNSGYHSSRPFDI